MGGISIWQLLIIAIIVALLFGTKRLRTLGSDVGTSIKGFQKAMKDDKSDKAEDAQDAKQEGAEKLTDKDQDKS